MDKTQRLFDKNSFAITRGHDFVEINGVKWATCNLGAENPDDPGLYFRWGDKKGIYAKDADITRIIWARNEDYCPDVWEDDPASVLWGGKWRLPTIDEARKLLNSCVLFTYKERGRFVFRKDKCEMSLPAGGFIINGNYSNSFRTSYIWTKDSSELSERFGKCLGAYIHDRRARIGDNGKYIGFNIRPVLGV